MCELAYVFLTLRKVIEGHRGSRVWSEKERMRESRTRARSLCFNFSLTARVEMYLASLSQKLVAS